VQHSIALPWALLVVMGGLAGCASTEQRAQPAPEPLRPVRYVVARAYTAERERTFTGSARAGVESKLSFKVPGTLRRRAVNVGDRLRSEAVIAELDDKDYRLKVQQGAAALNQAKAAARNASANYGRVRSLYENNSASRSDLDGARAAAEQAEATVQLLERQLEQANLQVTYTRLTAPADCAVAALLAEVNENVAAGQAVALVTYGGHTEVQVSVPETVIGRVEKGMPVQVTFDALPGKTFAAVVTEVGISATTVATTFPVTVRLVEGDDGSVRPGMAASVVVRFDAGDGRQRWLLPSFAVSEDDAGRFVFVVERDPDHARQGTVRRRAVTVGALTAGGMELLTGLADGDLVVTAGVSKIHDGLVVRLDEPGGI